jgi:16S rRNA (guanine527-N7)-methyltransferase
VLHSLAIALHWKPKPGNKAIDIGTGGGFPGIPLAILYPEVSFLLVDSIGKKLKAVEAISQALGLKNVEIRHARAEEIRGKYDVALSRAVARLAVLTGYCTRPRLKIGELYCLKGGDLREEVEEIDEFPSMVYALSGKFDNDFFETKKVVYVRFI